MSGHSHWAGIKHKKAVADKKRGKIFSKLARDIIIAVRHGGSDVSGNSTLALAIEKAKAANMPKENIARAIKRGTGELAGGDIEAYTYECYAPGGVALMLAVTTDNKNRTLPEIRKILERRGGKLGTSGCVKHVFKKKGMIRIPVNAADEDTVMEAVLEAGADDMQKEGDFYDVLTPPTELMKIKGEIEDAGLKIETAELSYIPTVTVALDEEAGRKLLDLLEELEDHDDIQNIYANYDLPESLFTDS